MAVRPGRTRVVRLGTHGRTCHPHMRQSHRSSSGQRAAGRLLTVGIVRGRRHAGEVACSAGALGQGSACVTGEPAAPELTVGVGPVWARRVRRPVEARRAGRRLVTYVSGESSACCCSTACAGGAKTACDHQPCGGAGLRGCRRRDRRRRAAQRLHPAAGVSCGQVVAGPRLQAGLTRRAALRYGKSGIPREYAAASCSGLEAT